MRDLVALLALLLAFGAAWAQESGEVDFGEGGGARMSAVEAQRVLERPVPAANAPKQAQVDYWLQRQRAAFTAGRSELRLEALRKLVELTEEKGKPNPYLAFLWREEVRFGNQSRALEIGESLVADKSIILPVRIAHMADLGLDYLGYGDASSARTLLRRAEDELGKVTGESAQPTTLNYMKGAVERLRARVALFDGDVEGADAAVRRGLEVTRVEYERAKAAASAGSGSFLYDRAIRARNGTMTTAIYVYSQLGRNVEAEALARQGLKLAEDERTGGGTLGIWHERIALAQLGERRFAEAEASVRKAIAEIVAGGAVPSAERLQLAQFTLLQSLLGQHRWAEADALYQQMRAASADDAAARTRTENATLQAFLHLKAGRIEEAKERIEGSITYRTRFYGEGNNATIEARAVRAMVLQARGDTRLALQDYEAVFKSIFATETSFRDSQPRGLRGLWIPKALDSYLVLVAAEHKRGGAIDPEMADRAFRVADRLQQSAVQQSLLDGASRVLAGTPELAALARREQEQRIRLADLLRQVNAQLEEEGRQRKAAAQRQAAKKDDAAAAAERDRQAKSNAEIGKTRQAIAAMDKDRGETQLEVAKRFPAYFALVNPKPPTLAEVAKTLGRDEAFVSLYPWSEGTFVWAVAGNGATAFHFSPLTSAQVAERVEKVRSTLDVGERAGSVQFDAETSHQLYAQLIAPVWPKLGNPKLVTFAGASELGRIPFATLVTQPVASGAQPQWLARTAAVNQVATAAAFKALRDGRSRSKARAAFFGFGDPLFADPSLPPLPETREEIVAIAKALGADPARDARFGKDATRKAALEAPLADRRVVAFATHGLKPGDLPGLSRPALAMAPAGTEPALLVLDDVLTLKLAADWVVLSACNTASSDGRAQEAFSGLARGFFFAGARSVLATHWAVETVSAQQLVTRAFAHQAANPSASRAESLRQAQLELIDGKAGPRFGHPFYWAPYALYGDPSL